MSTYFREYASKRPTLGVRVDTTQLSTAFDQTQLFRSKFEPVGAACFMALVRCTLEKVKQ
jgi:hypothetical protein